MGIEAFKAIIGMWLLAQIFFVPIFILDDEKKIALVVDFGALVLLIIMYFGLKLIGA